eukprot:TRINITY_DN48413_c0_g1_i1.p1 TRINITY_DN48413_c0_g1~~TRINITY_DN48413_c0_g1_i1.p1  ORF type:complete len:617 (+),score=167.04 TRINITY_DN48413_c0_g1_i1:74-1924(+)
MLSTPKGQRFRPSIGEPSRVARLRAQSPGASSIGSADDQPATGSPRRRSTILGSSRPGSRNAFKSRDPRPVGDRSFAAQCARNVVDFLSSRGYSKTFSHEKLLKDPSTKEFYDIFRFLIAQLDPQLEVDGKMEDEVPAIMRRLKYPVEVNRSKLQAISGPNTWPQLLAVLDWLTVLVRINDDLVEPLAACQLGLDSDERDAGDHHVLRSLHENYMAFLSGKDDSSDEDRLRQIYTERIEAMTAEIQRLETQEQEMQQQLQDFQAEHERLLDLQKQPMHLEMEADRLRGIIQAQEQKVQHIEGEIAIREAEEQEQQKEVEELQGQRAKLAEQVESQAYSKRDIERLNCERNHLRQLFKDLKLECEKAEQDVWELGMQENNRAEEIGRLTRQVNEAVSSLAQSLSNEDFSMEELRIRVDLSEPSDALAALDFEEQRSLAQSSNAKLSETLQKEESSQHELAETQRLIQEDLAERERECRHMKMRYEQLSQMRDDHREWSAEQLEDAQRTTEGTEDEVHAVSIGTLAPSIRDAAEVDKLKVILEDLKTQGELEKAQLKEQIRRDEERLEEHRGLMQKELENYARSAENLCKDVETALDEDDSSLLLDRRGSKVVQRGGC